MASTLSSSSTLAQVQAAYDDNASYAEDDSVAKARAFVTACTILMRRLPTEAGQSGDRVRLDANIQRLGEERTAAQRWLSAQGSRSPRYKASGFGSFR